MAGANDLSDCTLKKLFVLNRSLTMVKFSSFFFLTRTHCTFFQQLQEPSAIKLICTILKNQKILVAATFLPVQDHWRLDFKIHLLACQMPLITGLFKTRN